MTLLQLLPYPTSSNNVHYQYSTLPVQPTYVTPLEQSAYTNRHHLNSDNTRNDYSAAQAAPRNVPSIQASYPHNNQPIQFNHINLQSQQF